MEVNSAADHQSSDAFHAHPSGYPAYAPHHSDPTAAAANTQSEHGHDRYPAYHERQQPSQEHRQHRYQSHEHQEPYSDRDLRIPSPLQDQPSRHSQSHHLEHAQPTESSHHLHQHSQSHGHSSAHMYNLSRVDRNHVNGDSSNDSPHHVGQQDKVYDRERERYAYTSEQGPDSGSGSGSGNGNRTNSAGQSDHSTGIRSAPHSLHSYPPGHPSSSSRSAAVSHHPNALNRYPFSIPSISAKLDQPASEDGDDALSSLWKKTTPIQEPYFQTRHTIASQHTLSTLGGVLFSLDEVPLELTQDMYIAMRNRIFELEAKSVNYSPFSNSRKRPIDQSGLDDHRNRHGYDMDSGHHSKRPTYAHPQHPSSRPYGPPEGGRPSSSVHKFTSSYPSWYTPEVYTNGSHYPPHHRGQPSEQDREYRPSEGPYYDRDSRPPSRPSSPPPGHSVTRSVYSPPPAGPSSARLSGPLIQPRPHVAPPQESRPPHHPDDRSPPGPPQNGPYPPSNHSQQQPPHPHHQSNNGLPPSHHSQQPRTSQLPSHPHTQPPSHPHTQPTTHHQPPQLQHPSQIQHQQQPQGHGYTPQSAHQQHHSQHSVQPNGTTTGATTQITSTEIRQSIHQQRHRAQQQAQSAHSRSYHLHKHMRMLDQQRAAQIAAQQVQQQTQQPQQKAQPPKQPLRPIQRHYQPHQQMYPGYNQPVPIKPHPQPPSQQQQPQPQQQTQQQQQQQSQALRPNSFQPQQRMTQQQQMLQRYRQHHQLQQKQQQLRQLQYLRSRQTASYPTQKNSQGVGASSGSHSPTPPPRVFGSQVDRPIRKTTRPLECSNCMALDSLSWKPKSEVQIIALDGSTPSGGESAVAAATAAGGKILCPVCTQYLQTHGKPRPVPPFRTNFLKKIHTRFKRELQEVRFQGWQDAQVLEIEDRMVEREFQMVFNGLDESDVSQIQGRHSSTSGSPAPLASTMSVIAEMATSRDGTSSAVAAKDTETIVIKIEEDDDDEMPLKKAKPDNLEVRTFQSEASVGELFGQRWRTEPVVGYTLVHFGGSDRTRMVPMNPTVPSLTVAFNRSAETITFAFRVLVNGLCLLSSGGGPPALHMPEMADDEEDEEEEEEEEEVVVVPDKDKDDPSPSPPVTASATPSTAEAAGGDPVAATLDDATEKRSITATTSAAVAVTEIYAESVSAAASAEK